MIGDAIERIEAVAHAVRDETTAWLTQELAEQLPRGELNLLVVGQYKRGKSSLINALLEADVMPTGSLPVTGVSTAVRYGAERRINVLKRNGSERSSICVDDLALYVSEQFNPANRLGLERVELFWPAEAIRGLALFDTPGIGSVHAHNTAAAHAALPRADAAILVVGPEPPIGAEELRYARDVVDASERLFIVLNKSDLAGPALLEILEFTRDAVREVVGKRGPIEIVALSATRARDAQRLGAQDPAFAEFVSSLKRFVEQQGEVTRERSIRRRASALAQRLETLLAMRAAALVLPAQERAKRKALVEHALQRVDDRVRALELLVNDDVRHLSSELEDLLNTCYDRDAVAFGALGAELTRERSGQRRTERIEAAVTERAATWRADAMDYASKRLHLHRAKYARLFGEIEAAALKAGCDVLSVTAESLTAREVEFTVAGLTLTALSVPTTGLEIVVELGIDLLPAPLRQPILRRRYDSMLASELDALRGKLRHRADQDLEHWRKVVQTTILSSTKSTRDAILDAFGELSPVPTAAEEHERAHVRALRDEVSRIREELNGWEAARSEPPWDANCVSTAMLHTRTQ